MSTKSAHAVFSRIPSPDASVMSSNVPSPGFGRGGWEGRLAGTHRDRRIHASSMSPTETPLCHRRHAACVVEKRSPVVHSPKQLRSVRRITAQCSLRDVHENGAGGAALCFIQRLPTEQTEFTCRRSR